MKRRIIAAATLPAAGFTMFAAALAFGAQPASAAPDDTNGILNGASIGLPINAPVNVCGIAAGVLGDATAKCAAAAPRVASTPGYGDQAPTRGQSGYGTPGGPSDETPPESPGGPGNETPPETPSDVPTPTPTSSVPGAGQQEVPPGGGVSAGSPEAPTPTAGEQDVPETPGGELPVTGLPLAGMVGAGALVTAGGAALLYAGRHRRRFEV
ncbi:chaplin family protein [Catenuloplanes sp. NPDC051500]|uniref:chaplin family protein n=1 Tax=Catenuloplanes sp. NPDC051500 TaxID=3363959 RepID=UPI00379BC0F3